MGLRRDKKTKTIILIKKGPRTGRIRFGKIRFEKKKRPPPLRIIGRPALVKRKRDSQGRFA